MPPLPFRPYEVVHNVHLADDTYEIALRPADGQPVPTFVAGQWIGVRLPNEPDPTRKIAAFSIASAPLESKEHLDLGIKAYGERTHLLMQAKPGDRVNVQGPYGAFTLRPGTSRLVFFAGGIGVTPLRSMLRQSLLSKDPRELMLFYSNKTRSATAYEQEFRDLAKTNKNFTFVPILTGETPEGWDGETRRVDTDMMLAHLGGLRPDDEFLMCGPEPFMDAIKQDLLQLGVDVKMRLRKELFN